MKENKYTYKTNLNYIKPNYFSVKINKRTPSLSPRYGFTSTKNSSDEISCENFESCSTKSFCNIAVPMNTMNEESINDENLILNQNSNILLTMSVSEITNNSIDLFDVNQIKIDLPHYNKKHPTLQIEKIRMMTDDILDDDMDFEK